MMYPLPQHLGIPRATEARRDPLQQTSPLREITIAGVAMLPDCDGALFWEEEGLLVVADLHFEKGSSFAARGQFVPPYDTAATLARLTRLVLLYAPRTVIALGDSFHDMGGPSRLSPSDRDMMAGLQRGRDWIWITGNHDPQPSQEIAGRWAHELRIGPLTFVHEPTGAAGEVAGHLHPTARINWRGRTLVRRCFATDGTRMVMPAFGAFTGGLTVRDRAFTKVFGSHRFDAHVLGDDRLYRFPASRCC